MTMTLVEAYQADWRINARCRGDDPERRFPSAERPRLPKSAIESCLDCPVRGDCLEAALSSPWEPFGIWGGLMQGELYPLWRERHPVGGEQEIRLALGLREER